MAGKRATRRVHPMVFATRIATIRVLGLNPTLQAASAEAAHLPQLQDSAPPGRLRVAKSIMLFAAFVRHFMDCDEPSGGLLPSAPSLDRMSWRG